MRTAALLTALIATASAAATSAPAQWQILDAHTSADLRGIDYVGNGVAWASGSNGTVLRTEDMGFVWQLCAIPPGAEHLDFRGIQAFDNNTAIVMSSGKGDLSRLYKTTDGCQTWKLVFTNPDKDGFWDALRFELTIPREPSTGFMLGDPVAGAFRVFESDDGGPWLSLGQRGLVGDKQTQGAFAASNSAIEEINGFPIFGTGGVAGAFVYINTDEEGCPEAHCGGPEPLTRVWRRVAVPVGSHSASGGIFSLAIKRSGLGPSVPVSPRIVAVGGDYANPNTYAGTAAFSRDGGKHWTAATTPPHGYRSAVAYDPKSNTWITVGPNGTDVSSDDGRNWRALKPDPKYNDPPDADQHWNALSLPFVVGPRGRIGILRASALAAAPR